MKAHLLIVEDESILYDRMKMKLAENHYSVDDYTPSVEKAIEKINKKRPDLVLLDIQLKGKETGLDLGERLHKEFKIPFIYVTQYDDDETFYKGLHTQHEDFVIKSKPHLDGKELIRKIQTVLKRNENKTSIPVDALLCLAKYLHEIKNESHSKEVTKIPVLYKDIVCFSTYFTEKDKNNVNSLRPNYLAVITNKNEKLYLKRSLTDLQGTLPYQFCRINDKTIVNLSTENFNGRINGSRLLINNEEFTITPTYKDEVNKRIEFLYGSK